MNPSLVTSGAMSFNPTVHGTPMASMSFFGSQMPFMATPCANENMSEETAMRIAGLQVKLDQKLGPEYISQRQGPRGGPKLTYAEGWKIINLANEVFGFNGWSSNLINVTTDFVDRNESGRYSVGVTAVVRVTLKEGVYHEDIGYGTAENSPSKGQALDKCKKEAVTDGLKRALRNFGNLMGNCLYDKAYTQEVVKMKVPPAKFDKSELHRRPEFSEDNKPQTNPANTSKPPVPQFNPNTSTPTLAPMSRRSTAIGARDPLVNGRPSVMNARPSASTTNHNISSSNSSTSVQSTRSVSSENSRSLQSFQNNQPQQQEAQNRRVSFVETSPQGSRPVATTSVQDVVTKSEPEDSFEFGDDESFLAALGVEESDLGRPIETDADMGPPIDHEESYLPPEGNSNVTVNDTSVTGVPVNHLPRSDKAARVQRLQEIMNATTASNTSPLQTTPPLQQSTPLDQMQNVVSPSSMARAPSTALRPLNPAHQASHQTTVDVQQRNHRPFARPAPNHQNQNQNENLPPNSSESGTKRPLTTTPSMGGFHFPPGMDPLQPHNGGAQQGQLGGSGVGIKRSADTMSGTGGNSSGVNTGGVGGGGFRGPRPGMGLQQAAPQQRREPFLPLEIGDSGVVKRIRR